MSAIKKVLAAIAFSDYSQGVLNYAALLAKALGAELVVANVINVRDVQAVEAIAARGYNLDSGVYVKELKAQNRSLLVDLLKATGFSETEVKMVFKVGHPVDGLLRIISDEKVDLVVMGIKGRTNLEYALVGSVAEKLFRRSPVTIVSYRDAKHGQRLLKAMG